VRYVSHMSIAPRLNRDTARSYSLSLVGLVAKLRLSLAYPKPYESRERSNYRYSWLVIRGDAEPHKRSKEGYECQ
jgi:hypothetical protein